MIRDIGPRGTATDPVEDVDAEGKKDGMMGREGEKERNRVNRLCYCQGSTRGLFVYVINSLLAENYFRWRLQRIFQPLPYITKATMGRDKKIANAMKRSDEHRKHKREKEQIKLKRRMQIRKEEKEKGVGEERKRVSRPSQS